MADKALPLFAVSLSGKRREVATIPGTLRLLDVARDGRVLLARWDLRLSVRASKPGGSERDLSSFGVGFLGDLSADGQTVVFADRDALFMRRTDGSPPIRLGQPYGFFLNRLSPDGRWVLTTPASGPAGPLLVPTGAGEIRRLDAIPKNTTAAWFPDGKRLLCETVGSGRVRLFVFDLQSGRAMDVPLPAGLSFPDTDPTLSPDGARIAAVNAKGDVTVVPVAAGAAVKVASGAAGHSLIGWAEDGRHLYLYRIGDVPARVQTLDLASGKLELWRELTLEDLAGVIRIHPIKVTPDGRSWAYSYARVLSDLYLVEGLK
jgi:dipeptidyl aminopeptidase/acylaminoacyl peptidase